MELLVSFSSVYLMPVYGLIFCFSLVNFLKKLNQGNNEISKETSLLTISLILIIWTLSLTITLNS